MITFKTFLLENYLPQIVDEVDDALRLIAVPKYRGDTEVGKKFKQFILDMAKTLKCEQVEVSVFSKWKTNVASISFHFMPEMSKWTLEQVKKAFYARAKKYLEHNVKIQNIFVHAVNRNIGSEAITLDAIIDEMNDDETQEFQNVSITVKLFREDEYDEDDE